MLSLAFTTQQVAVESAPDTANAARLHPVVQIGLLSGLHLVTMNSSSIVALGGNERLAKVSTFGR